ncbi:MAG: LysE family translocator [Halioglobus sp.]|nr:LysE family translocator [Halioglobus sp.]
MEFSHWLSLLGICLLGAMSPGPSLAVVLKCSLGGGRGAGLSAALAHGVGVGLYGLLTVTGLAGLITATPAVYRVLQLAGALYLLYLGARALRSNPPQAPVQAAPLPAGSRGPAMEGFLVAFLNPKLAVFMLALFSQFLQAGFGALEKGLMALTVGITDALWYALVVLLVSRRGFLETLRANARIIDRCFGVILVLLALSVIADALRSAA